MLFEIIQPSDPYTISCPDLEIAFTACVLLGAGQYVFHALEDGGVDVPFFLFDGEADRFCQTHFGTEAPLVLRHVRTDRRADLIAALDSVVIGDRDAFNTTMPPRADVAAFQKARDAWQEQHRSSLNDIGGRAYRIAEKLRQNGEAHAEPPPQQVFLR